MKLAILDDYQGVALEAADWSSIAPAVAISVFDAHLGDSDAVDALGFDLVDHFLGDLHGWRHEIEGLPHMGVEVQF